MPKVRLDVLLVERGLAALERPVHPPHGERRTGQIEHPEEVRHFPIMDETVELETPHKAVGVAPEIAIDDLRRKPEVGRA